MTSLSNPLCLGSKGHSIKTSQARRLRGVFLGRLVCLLLWVGLMASGFSTTAFAQKKDDKDKESEVSSKDRDRDDDDSLYDCPERKRRGRYVVSLKPETELTDLIKWAMTFHCKNFVYASEISRRSSKVTIMTPNKMTASEAWRVFLVALQSMNLTVVPKGNVMEIVERPKAKTQALPIFTRGRAPSTDQMVRVILRPEFLPVEDLGGIFNELKSADGKVKALPNAGVVMVTDLGSNVRSMSNLMLSVDRPVAGEKLYMIKVKHADATELSTKLNEILGAKEKGSSSSSSKKSSKKSSKSKKSSSSSSSSSKDEVAAAIPSKMIPDERTNTLIILGSEASYLRVKSLVSRLDVGVGVQGAGRIHVYVLENADSEEMANTLTSVISGIQQGAAATPQRGGRNQRTPARPTSAAASQGVAAFEGQVRVTHDQPTNSLVIVASVKDFLALQDVIRQLDSPRPQVYIEANIVEVSVDDSREFGASAHAGTEGPDGSLLVGGVQHQQLGSLNVASLATSTGLLGGALGPLIPNAEELLGTSIPSFGVLFQALATNNNVNVLSSPHILTTDNEEAEISVGQNIPFQSALVGGAAGAAGAAGGFFPTQSISRQDVALTLKITPHINASSMVRLEIDLEISDIAAQDFNGLGPSWSRRLIKDTVVVRDEQSVVIGGLISDRDISSRSKIPLLGDIPVLGKLLFSYNDRQKEKRNLLVLLTPHIMNDQLDLERLVERRTLEQKEFVRSVSSIDNINYRPNIDYRRKRGVLEEINRTVGQNQKEASILEELDQKMIQIPDGPVVYELETNDGGMEFTPKEAAEAEGTK